MAKTKVAKEATKQVIEPGGPGSDPPKTPVVRERYGTFYDAWVKVHELRQYTQRNAQPRIGLDSDGLAKAKALIKEYANG